MEFIKIAILLALLFILFAIYEIIGLIKKKATTYYYGEDGRFHAFGDSVFKISSDAYIFHDNTQPSANQLQGNSNIDNGLALINLRTDPAASDLTNSVQKSGWVDLSGNVYEKSGLRVGYIVDAKGRRGISGSGKWYELWLRKHSYVYTCPPIASENGDSTVAEDQLMGKVIETGRLGKAKPNKYTVTARAGGFLLLYKDRQPKPASEDAVDEKTTWKDTALPAAIVFTFIYFLFYIIGLGKCSFPALGEQIGFIAALLFVYFAIWAILRQIKIESSLNGRSFDNFLMLIDRNTGVGGLNNWIILTAAASLLVSIFIYGSDFIPLQAALLIGTWVNRKYITREPWELSDSSEEEDEEPEPSDDDDDDDEDDGEGNIERTYSWTLDSFSHQVEGDITLTFNSESIAALRASNPFKLNPTRIHDDNVSELFQICTKNKRVHQLLHYIKETAQKEGLSELEKMQFILDFVQMPNIAYEYDEKCDEIGNPLEYARFPDETMFDGRGDCDCKAVLASILFREAGYKSAYILTHNHAATAVAFKHKNSSELVSLAEQSLVTKDGYMYFFCETTGDGFTIGDLGSTTKESIRNIIFLN